MFVIRYDTEYRCYEASTIFKFLKINLVFFKSKSAFGTLRKMPKVTCFSHLLVIVDLFLYLGVVYFKAALFHPTGFVFNVVYKQASQES